MEPKSILHKNGNLEILIDAESFAAVIKDDSSVRIVLDHVKNTFFNMMRTPYNTGIYEIDKIPHFDNDIDYETQLGGIKYKKEGKWSGSQAVPHLQNVEIVGKEIFHKDTLSEKELEKIWNVFVHHSIAEYEGMFLKKTSIYVTEDIDILKNRNWFAEHVPGEPLVIVTAKEALEIMDLFTKNLGKYFIESFQTANRSYWYWIYFRILIPHFNTPTTTETYPLTTLSTRFVFLLQSLDEMGINYYKEVNNDTGDSIQYHFNYFIALITGIFDSLARTLNLHYNINIEKQRGPSSISISNNSGKYFLKKIRKNNEALRNYLEENMSFINLIYELRENVLHRDFQRSVSFGTSTKTDANLLRTSKDVVGYLRQLKDEKKQYDEYSQWGLYVKPMGSFISPYEFSKAAGIHLCKFIDKCLEKLGFSAYPQENTTSESMKNIRKIKTKSLGYRLGVR